MRIRAAVAVAMVKNRGFTRTTAIAAIARRGHTLSPGQRLLIGNAVAEARAKQVPWKALMRRYKLNRAWLFELMREPVLTIYHRRFRAGHFRRSTKICLACGESFVTEGTVKAAQRKFCSRACYGKSKLVSFQTRNVNCADEDMAFLEGINQTVTEAVISFLRG
jgi:hypothetical protein